MPPAPVNKLQNDFQPVSSSKKSAQQQQDELERPANLPPRATKEFDFHWVYSDEPHASRRKAILQKHPEIVQLFGPEIKTFYMVVALVGFQYFMAIKVIPMVCAWESALLSNVVFWFLCWAVSGTINHSLQLAGHELSHNLCFESTAPNMLLAIFANTCTGIPSASSFRKYHMDHHQYQGVDQVDTDIPTNGEVQVFGNNTFMKLIWVFLQPFFYAIRPLFMKPKKVLKWDVFNFIVLMAVDVLVIYHFGINSFLYFLCGSLLGMGLHPSAGHFIAEHYEFVKGSETYSYYGPINYINFNVGYHNEHHDFPKIAWSRLPRVREIAPEYYENLPCHTSYAKVFWDYITDPTIGPFSRVKRLSTKGE